MPLKVSIMGGSFSVTNSIFFIGRIDAQTESDGTMSHGKGVRPIGPQYVRGLEGPRSTGRTRRCTNSEFIHHQQDTFALDELEADITRVREAVYSVPVHF